jgi:hypothetical protein
MPTMLLSSRKGLTLLNVFFDIYNDYARVSGASINRDKCVLMKQGRINEFDNRDIGIKVEDKVKICGIWFGKGAQKLNETKILDGIRDSVTRYEKRNLNLYTRSTIINTVFLAKLWYTAAVFDFSKAFVKEVDSIIFKFLWRSTEWIARNVLVNNRTQGGLGIVHVKAKIKALRLMHLVQVLKDPDKISSVLAQTLGLH